MTDSNTPPAVVRARLARAVRAGDAEAEAEARRDLAAVKIAQVVDQVRRTGVRLSAEQGEAVREAVAGVTDWPPAAASHGRVSVHTDPVPLRPSSPQPGTEW